MRALGFASLKALPRGIAVLSAQLSVPDGCWHIAELHVHPSHRGRGIGSVLIARADEVARMHGRSCIGLTTRTNNPARRLYERLGYVVVRTKNSRLYERFTGAEGRVLMTKDLV
jgi:ribosomal protein S18 acetylase RimI-like enzyme